MTDMDMTDMDMTDMEMRRRRALYRAVHRGTKEMDHVIGRYAESALSAMDEGALTQFERFLALPDPLLQSWVLSGDGSEAEEFQDLVAGVRRFHGLT